MLTITELLDAQPNPTPLGVRITFTQRVFSDNPPELATFCYELHQDSNHIFESSPDPKKKQIFRETLIQGGENQPTLIRHSVDLAESATGSPMQFAIITQTISDPAGNTQSDVAAILIEA